MADAAEEPGSFGAGERQVVAALAKQLGVEAPAAERIFRAGLAHAERAQKRRRLSAESGGGAAAAAAAATAPPAAAAAAPSAPGGGASPPAAAAASTAPGEEGFRFSAAPGMEELRRELAEFALERSWDQFHAPRNLALAMVGEVGELCECFQWKGEVAEGLPGWSEKERQHLGQELADVLLYLLRLSHKCRVDLPAAAAEKLSVNAAKYPAFLVRGSSKKYSEYGAGAAAAKGAVPPAAAPAAS